MATTPEGKVKKKLDKMLTELGVWYFSPQSGPFGRSGIPDRMVCARGHLVGIEVKADKSKKPTALQTQCMEKIEAAGGTCFVVYDDLTIAAVGSTIARILAKYAKQRVLGGAG